VANDRANDLGEGWYLVEAGDERWLVAMVAEPDGTWVFVNGQVARIESASSTERHASTRKRGEASVMSPMPATVIAINAVVGQTVTEGDTIIVLEAMKMELPIKAPRSGVVKAVHCAKGDLVQPGVTLLELA
jgi:acetyl-CoA/propionyl-CoA carboxylase biotin carboxyl carrier protein